MFCAVDPTWDIEEGSGSGSMICDGDSGSAIKCGSDFGVLTGVTSAGEEWCAVDVPAIFTKVSSYSHFIIKTMSKN